MTSFSLKAAQKIHLNLIEHHLRLALTKVLASLSVNSGNQENGTFVVSIGKEPSANTPTYTDTKSG